MEQRLFELEEVQKALPNLQSVREQAEKTLAAGDFAPEVRAKIGKYAHALQKLEHVEADHAAARERLSRLADAERLHLQLDHAQAVLTATEGRLARAGKILGHPAGGPRRCGGPVDRARRRRRRTRPA